MPICLDDSGDKYEALRGFRLETSGQHKPEPIEPGDKIGVATQGFYTTDGEGQTLKINGHDTAVAIANIVNHAWELWIDPYIVEMEQKDEDLPAKVKGIRIYLTEDGSSVVINPEGVKCEIVPYPDSGIESGDDVLFDDILDVHSIDPPTVDGEPCSYIEFLFKGGQVSVCFDFRPSHEEYQFDEWGQEDRDYYSRVVAMNWITRFYGHPPLVVPKLRKFDIPLPINCEQSKISKLIDTVEQEPQRKVIDQEIEELFSAEVWEELLQHFEKSEGWNKRLPIFEDALDCYRAEAYGGAVTQLMAQVEGVVMDSLIPKGLGLQENGESESWDNVIDSLSEILDKKDFGPIRTMVAEASIAFLNDSKLYSWFKWKKDSEEINRHASLHGHNLDYNTKANADRLWMLHDALFWLLGYDPPA